MDRVASGRILVIDDNAGNISLIEQVLAQAGHQFVKCLLDPSEAIQTMRTWKPDAILLDLHMPKLSGFDILTQMRDEFPAGEVLPVLVFTADQTMTARQRALALGAHDFVTKPFDAIELVLRLRNLIRMRQMHIVLQDQNVRLKQANEALSKSERSAKSMAVELKAANEELEGFTHSVSHDLRGPLRAILSTSYILRDDYGENLDEDAKVLIGRQIANAKKLTTIIEELLKLAKVTRTEMKIGDLDISALAAEVAQEMDADVNFEIQPDMHGRGDPLLAKLALQNLMHNAAKFSHAGGIVTVGMHASETNPIFFVRDHGIGFDMAHSSRLFKPFERLVDDKEFPGTGIGLANVKRIVSKHGGRIWAEGTPGEGACFFFTLAPTSD